MAINTNDQSSEHIYITTDGMDPEPGPPGSHDLMDRSDPDHGKCFSDQIRAGQKRIHQSKARDYQHDHITCFIEMIIDPVKPEHQYRYEERKKSDEGQLEVEQKPDEIDIPCKEKQ